MNKDYNLIIISILLFSSLLSLISIIMGGFYVDLQFFIGFLGVILSFIYRFKSKHTSKLILGVLLLLGTLNLIKFSHGEIGFSIYYSNYTIIGFNPIVIVLMFLYIFINREFVDSLFMEKKSTEEVEENKENEIKNFMNEFENKSSKDLKVIINNPDDYLKSAVDAAKRILNEKETN